MTHATTLLIVDDEEAGRETLAGLLYHENYELCFAANGVDALALAQAQHPDLILLDVMMPGVDGYEVCRRIRADPALAEVPIILVTALDDRDARLEGIEAGADDFISKPFDRAELRARIRTIVRLNRYRRLHDQRATFEWVVDRAADGYVLLDARGTISYLNATAMAYLGVDSSACAVGQRLGLLLRRDYQIEPEADWDSWPIQPPDAQIVPQLVVRPESDEAAMRVLTIDLLELGDQQNQRYLLWLRDVTETLADQQTVWSFQALVRHKLGTAASQLNGALGLIEHLQGLTLSASDRDLLDIAVRGARRLRSDITDIFQFMEAKDGLGPYRSRCALETLPALIEQAGQAANIDTLHIDRAALDGVPAGALAISCQALELIVGEVLENARKFHPTHSPVVDVTIAPTSDGIQIDLCDDGRSLTPEQLARVWQPYFQGERSFTGQVPGMGLGLAMVAMLLRRVGGTSRMYNRPSHVGVGVALTIPLA